MYRRFFRYWSFKCRYARFPLKPIPMGDGFCLMETENPNKGLFANKRQKLNNKYLSKFQIIPFPDFMEKELIKYIFGPCKKI